MAENLVVVESPAKAETIKRYLGNKFEVLASDTVASHIDADICEICLQRAEAQLIPNPTLG